jgi:peptide/nickel transport system permease protein
VNLLESDLTQFVHVSNGERTTYEKINEIRFACLALKGIYDRDLISIRIKEVNDIIASDTALTKLQKSGLLMAHRFEEMQTKATPYKNYIPVVSFYPYNQYHRWLFGDGNILSGKTPVFSRGILRGDFGTSYVTGLPVMQELLPRIKWSMILAFLAIMLAMAISIPVGLRSAARENGYFDKISGGILFFFFSMPVFWVGTLLLLLFANPDVLQLLPTSGIKPVTGYPADATWGQKIILTAPYLVLPLFCYTYGATSYLSRSIRISVIGELSRDYIRTARAKGVSYPEIISRHAFANSKLPLITLLANVLPQSVTGSLIIETIFTIPGMGFETINAFQHQNYPVIVAIFTITGFLTIIGYFIADIMYAIADPRISYKKEIH